jgi:hypothetical protein
LSAGSEQSDAAMLDEEVLDMAFRQFLLHLTNIFSNVLLATGFDK